MPSWYQGPARTRVDCVENRNRIILSQQISVNLSTGQTDSQVNAKLELAKGAQTDSQVGSQVAKICFYNRLLVINLCRLVLGGQTVKKTSVHLRPN